MKGLAQGRASSDGRLTGAPQGMRQQGQHPRVSVRNPTFSWPSRGLYPSFLCGRQSPWVEGPGNSSPGALKSFIRIHVVLRRFHSFMSG